ncbi:hypothetical protein SpCBS45565_g02007 [Spizellomyces sp. 'palustris']|nr:hypothetical protein SpCBS45565_g02007 [Spizellomyces sp. 'palustris']
MADEYEKVATAFTVPVAKPPWLSPTTYRQTFKGPGGRMRVRSMTGLLAERFAGIGTQILATDFADSMVIKIIQKKASDNGWKNVTGQVMDATVSVLTDSCIGRHKFILNVQSFFRLAELDVLEDSFDAVSCIFGIMLMPTKPLAKCIAFSIAMFYDVGGKRIQFQSYKKLLAVSSSKLSMTSHAATGGWRDLYFCIEELEKAGFSKVEGQRYRGTWVFNNLDKFLGPLVRNPGREDSVLKDFTPEELEQFQAQLKQHFDRKVWRKGQIRV